MCSLKDNQSGAVAELLAALKDPVLAPAAARGLAHAIPRQPEPLWPSKVSLSLT